MGASVGSGRTDTESGDGRLRSSLHRFGHAVSGDVKLQRPLFIIPDVGHANEALRRAINDRKSPARIHEKTG